MSAMTASHLAPRIHWPWQGPRCHYQSHGSRQHPQTQSMRAAVKSHADWRLRQLSLVMACWK
jgi:hypothetical protein